METWPLALAAFSAFFASVAAVASLLQARRAAQSNEVNVYLAMSDEYRSDEMRTAISCLANFWREQNEAQGDVVSAFKVLMEQNPRAASEVRGQCRLLSGYFVDAARLYKGRFISPNIFKLMIAHPGLNVFYEVAVPINRYKNPHHNSVKYAPVIRSVLEKHGSGIF